MKHFFQFLETALVFTVALWWIWIPVGILVGGNLLDRCTADKRRECVKECLSPSSCEGAACDTKQIDLCREVCQ